MKAKKVALQMKKFIIKRNKSLRIKIVLLAIVFLYNCISELNAATINATSCSQIDVQAAIDSASNGDTVMVPAGTATWTYCMEIDPMPSIILQGAGIDQTIIINEVPRTGWKDSPMWITSEEGSPFRITGFTFQGGQEGTGNSDHGTINLGGICKNWRIDHVKFDHLYSRGIRISGYTLGVIDHCEFTDNHTQCIYVDQSGWGGNSYGDGSWASPLSLGTEQAIYIEDNTFTWESEENPLGVVDGCGGSRYVFRYNAVDKTGLGNHGTESTGRARSCFSYEIYNNTFTRTITPGRWTIFFNRGGTGVIFNNTVTGNYTSLCHVAVYREFHAFDPWGACDGTSPYDVNDGVTYESGTHTGSNGDSVSLVDDTKSWTQDQWFGYSLHNTIQGKSSAITSNTENTITYKSDPYADDLAWNTGDTYIILRCYPCLDQVGRSTGNLLSNWDPPLPQEWPDQAVEPFYEWNNTINGEDADIVSDSPHLLENRDYYNDTQRPGYSPYTYPHPLVTNDPEYKIIINVYPNPCRVYQGENTITFFGDLSIGDNIKVFDMSGKLVHNSGELSEATYQWGVSEITSGVYFFVVKSSDGETKTSGKIAVIR